jgi:hypothetical protein
MLGLFFGRNPIMQAIAGIAGVALVVFGLSDHRHILALAGGAVLVVSIARFVIQRRRQ